MIGQFSNSTCKCHTQLLWTVRYFASDIDPVKLSYDVYGENNDIQANSALIILHALFGSKQNWRNMAHELEAKLKKRVYALDARNHGESEHSPNQTSAAMAADVAHFMKIHNLPKACVLGHSMGGHVMMYLALKYVGVPQLVDRGIIVDILPTYMPPYYRNVKNLLRVMQDINVSPTLTLGVGRRQVAAQIKPMTDAQNSVDYVIMNLKKRDSGEFYWCLNLDAILKNLKDYGRFKSNIVNLPPFHGPMCFVCGSRSKYFKPDYWPAVKKSFPNSELREIDAGHMVHSEKPKEFVELAVEFLKK